MKSIILSQQGQNWLSEHGLSPQNWDVLMIEQHATFLLISRNSQRFQQFPLKIDFLQVILELEYDPVAILIQEIHGYDESCD